MGVWIVDWGEGSIMYVMVMVVVGRCIFKWREWDGGDRLID